MNEKKKHGGNWIDINNVIKRYTFPYFSDDCFNAVFNTSNALWSFIDFYVIWKRVFLFNNTKENIWRIHSFNFWNYQIELTWSSVISVVFVDFSKIVF